MAPSSPVERQGFYVLTRHDMTTLPQIKNSLQLHKANSTNAQNRTRASVALLLQNPHNPEIFFIRRAPHPLDPWSGDIGFPGGRIDPDDNSALDAAIRETKEETGITLSKARLLGQIDDLVGDHLPIIVSCFVFEITEPEPLICNHEVSEAFWLPVSYITSTENQIEAPVKFGETELIRSAIKMPKENLPVLWGITYRLIQNFCAVTNVSFPNDKLPPLP